MFHPLHDITAIYVCIDDLVEIEERRVGRKSALSDSELLSILLFGSLLLQTKQLKSIYKLIKYHYLDYFPCLPKYQNFVAHSHRVLPLLLKLLQTSLDQQAVIGQN